MKACTLSRKTGYPQWREWLAKEDQSGGAILDLLSHDIDQALKLFGQPDSVSAVSQGEVDTMVGSLHYARGFEVKIEGGWFPADVPFSAGFHIASENAALFLQAGELKLQLADGEHTVDQPRSDEYRDEIHYFIECCRDNVTPAHCPPEDSARAVHIATLLRRSREQNGKEVSCET